MKNASPDLDFFLLEGNNFKAAAKKSVDYAVMEKTKRAAVVRADYGWSDLGGWHAVWDHTSRDKAGNATRGKVVLLDSNDSYIASDNKLVAVLGVKNLVAVIEDDAVLIADRSRAEDLRRLVDELRKRGHSEADAHARVHRPWGNYQSLDNGDRYQVKRIIVKSGRSLIAAKAYSSRRALDRRARHRARHHRQGTSATCTRTSRSMCRSAASTGWRTSEKSRSN